MFWAITAFRIAHVFLCATLVYRLAPQWRRAFSLDVRNSDLKYAVFAGFAFTMMLFVMQGLVTSDMPDASGDAKVTALAALRCVQYALASGVIVLAHKVRTWAGDNDA